MANVVNGAVKIDPSPNVILDISELATARRICKTNIFSMYPVVIVRLVWAASFIGLFVAKFSYKNNELPMACFIPGKINGGLNSLTIDSIIILIDWIIVGMILLNVLVTSFIVTVWF